ncbi:MAG: hypothetical protein CMC13_12515 [Flavobacteriaceae bacterium]|nr:hypothetical protein [Flavobacteriaceae bacterium]|tara:strand:- start:878 stop:1624 length:747 start_codon:yes stop_codon:yes gene_type:complete
MKRKIYLTSCLLIVLTGFVSTAQVGIGTTTPDPSSILELNSDKAGFLPPRMSTVDRTAIASPVEGLTVYDTDLNSYYVHDGSNWVKLVSESSTNDFTGWGDYVDGQYTSASPLIVNTTKITLPNNAATTRDSQKPTDIATFYDATTQTITGRNGDAINISVEFKARPNSSSVTRLTVAIDIGGAVGEIYIRDFVLSKGNNVEHYYLSSFNAYTLDTWENNGGTVKVVSTASTDIYDIRYIISRVHKAR